MNYIYNHVLNMLEYWFEFEENNVDLVCSLSEIKIGFFFVHVK